MKRLFNLISTTAVGLSLLACEAGGSFDMNMAMPGMGGMASDEMFPEQGGDRFDEIIENGFIETAEQNVSTFSIDADGAAYGYMRKMLSNRRLPDPSAVRI